MKNISHIINKYKYKYKYKKVFVLGTGGGNDILSATIIARQLSDAGISVDVGGVLSPAATHIFGGLEEQVINVVVKKDTHRYINSINNELISIDLIDRYLPEIYTDFKFFDISFKFGTHILLEEFNKFITTQAYDLVIGVDVGGDILGDINDTKLLSPMMDFTSLYLLGNINIDTLLIEFGLGTDGELRTDGMKRILEELDENIIDSFEFKYHSNEITEFENNYNSIKHIRAGNTNRMFLETLKTDNDIHTSYKVKSQIGKRKWVDIIDIHLPNIYAGKAWVFDAVGIYQKRKKTSFAYDSPIEQYHILKDMCPYWKTEVDLSVIEGVFLDRISLNINEKQRQEILKEIQSIIQS